MKRVREKDDDGQLSTKRARGADDDDDAAQDQTSPFCDLVVADVCALMAKTWLTVRDRVMLNRTCTLFRTLFPVRAGMVPAPWVETARDDEGLIFQEAILLALERHWLDTLPPKLLALAVFGRWRLGTEQCIKWPRIVYDARTIHVNRIWIWPGLYVHHGRAKFAAPSQTRGAVTMEADSFCDYLSAQYADWPLQ